jgi:WD40 repeat protein
LDFGLESGECAVRSEALIVAQPFCDQWEQLPRAAAAARELADGLTKSGYTVACTELLDGSDKLGAEQALADWFGKIPQDARLILFWTGHGASDGGHYLICRNSPRAGLTAFNAIDAGSLGPVIANCKAEKILVLLDTCYSGQGAAEISSAFARVLAIRSPTPGQERAIAVIASAHPLEKAMEGIFCNAVRSVLFDPKAQRLWSEEDVFIHSEFLARAVRKLLPSDVSRPEYKADGIGQDFIPNPLHHPGQVAEVVEERAWRLAQSGGGQHFDLAARGIEVGTSGWYFAGRHRLLKELVKWLESAQHGVRIVTGPPGSGKSAVMGRLATLSDPEYRKAAMQARVLRLVGNEAVPPEGIIDVAIHAKGKTLDDCARAIAQALLLPIGKEVTIDVEALVSAIEGLDRRVTILIDGLDEAASGQGQVIATRLIVPLGRHRQVRVLVGSRRSVDGAVVPAGEKRHGPLHSVFGSDAHIDDLEDESETKEDIAEYVRLRLAASPKHSNDLVGIAMAAERVSERAGGVFLYARIVSRTLQELVRLDGALPATALEAFANDLQSRFGAEEQRVDDLLAALAWGQGKGLTRRVWPQVANAFAGRSYDDDDVQWVLDHAGWHVIETGEDGQAVYRLGHQALADHYQGHHEATEAQGRIVRALTEGVAGAAWLDTDRYLWRHVAEHAVESGRLAALICDPGYLAVADPAGLVALLPSVREEQGRRLADIYDRVVDRLIGQPPLERLALIHLTAQMEAPDLESMLEPPVATHWRCRWARVQQSTPHRILGRHSAPVTAVAFGEIDGRAVVVSGSRDESIRLWDAHTGEPIGPPLEGHKNWVTAVALGRMVDGRTVVVSGGRDCSVRLWDALTGQPIGRTFEGHPYGVTAVALGMIDGRTAIASGSYDKTIRLWDASTGEPIGGPFNGHTGSVNAVALGMVDGRAVVASGSDDETIRLWDAGTRELIRRPPYGHRGRVTAVALGRMVDGRVVVVSGSEDRTIRLWDAGTGEPIGGLNGHYGRVTAVALGRIVDGRAVVVSGSEDRTIRLWDAGTGEPIGLPFEGHRHGVKAVTLGEVNGRAVIVSGSDDKTIRLWDARISEPIGRPAYGHTGSVNTVALGMVEGRAMVVSGGRDGTIWMWDARTGEPIGPPIKGVQDSDITAVALGIVEGRAVVVSGDRDGNIWLWDPRKGQRMNGLEKSSYGTVAAVALGMVKDRAMVVSGSFDKTIRLWDALTGASTTPRPLKGQRTRSATAVAIGMVDHAGGGPFAGHTGSVNAVALGMVDDRAVVVSASWDKTIRLWDALTGEPIGQPFEGHQYGVTAIALGMIDGRAVVVLGGHDNSIRLWDVRDRREQFAIELGTEVSAIAYDPNLGIAVGTSSGVLCIQLPEAQGPAE